jgi:hypothetical protein
VRVNSTPEKMARKKKWMVRSEAREESLCSTVRLAAGRDEAVVVVVFFSGLFVLSACGEAVLTPRVSGRATIKKMVSTMRRTSVMNAGMA